MNTLRIINTDPMNDTFALYAAARRSVKNGGLRNLIDSIFDDKDMDEIFISNEVKKIYKNFQKSKTYEDAMNPANAIGFIGADTLLNTTTNCAENMVAVDFGDETGAFAIMQFSHELPLHIVHSVLTNIGHWKVKATILNPNNGNLVVGLSRKLHGYAIYIVRGFDSKTGHFKSFTNPIVKTRWFLTEEEAVIRGDATAKEIFDLSWAELVNRPMEWPFYDCEDTEEFGFVHLNCLPNGDSIGIKLTNC